MTKHLENKTARTIRASTLACLMLVGLGVSFSSFASVKQTVIVLEAIRDTEAGLPQALITDRRLAGVAIIEPVAAAGARHTSEGVVEQVAELRCPTDYFTAAEIAAAQETRFAFPIPNPFPAIAPEPLVIHRDTNQTQGTSKQDCVPYAAGHLCYDDHEGTDYSLTLAFATMASNVEVTAAADGIVRNAIDGNADLCAWTPSGVNCLRPEDPWNFDMGSANKVDICHADGKRSQYLHLMKNSVRVAPGDRVACGDLLGFIGSSGMSSGPHLHFDVLLPTGSGGAHAWVDPYAVNNADGHWVNQNNGNNGTLPSSQCQ